MNSNFCHHLTVSAGTHDSTGVYKAKFAHATALMVTAITCDGKKCLVFDDYYPVVLTSSTVPPGYASEESFLAVRHIHHAALPVRRYLRLHKDCQHTDEVKTRRLKDCVRQKKITAAGFDDERAVYEAHKNWFAEER